MVVSEHGGDERAAHQEQLGLWNGSAGMAWVEAQAVLDAAFAPFESMLVAAVRAAAARSVLDVGCGTGSTTRAVARLLAEQGSCTGIDISEPMLAAAAALARADNVTARFIRGDAQSHAFEPASFDMIVSRFGVMFFDDCVQAFTNLRRALREGGSLRFIAWRGPQQNPFMTAAERAAAPWLPSLPLRQADVPGQFGLASASRIRSILEASGWGQCEVEPVDVPCEFAADQLHLYMTRLGPLGRVLGEAAEPARSQILSAVRAAFEPYVQGERVRFNAACWNVGALAVGSARSNRMG